MQSILRYAFAASALVCAAMAGLPAAADQNAVNIGVRPNDRTGDNERSAYIKLNANDAELYAAIAAIKSQIASLALTLPASPTFLGTVTTPSIAITGPGSTGDVSGMSTGGTLLSDLKAQTYGLPLTFDTISGTTIPGTAFKGSANTPWVRGSSSGPNAVQDAAGTWWNVDLSQNIVRVEWFRRVGDGLDWGPAFQRAAAALKATTSGGSIALYPRSYTFATAANITKTGAPLRIAGEGRATALMPVVGNYNPLLSIGDTSAGAIHLTLSNFAFVGQNKTNSRAVALTNANGIVFDNIDWEYQYVAIEAANTHGVTIRGGNLIQIGQSLYHSSTASNALHVTGLHATNVGYDNAQAPIGGLIKIDADAYNFVMKDNDIEVFTYLVQFANAYTPAISDNYTEQHSDAPIKTTGTIYNARIDNNLWSIPQSGFAWTLAGFQGGTFGRNTLNSATVTFGPTVVDMDVADQNLVGTGSVGPAPWQTPTLLNGFTQQTNYTPVAYRKVRGKVELRGNLVNASATFPVTVFTLPTGYRPATRVSFVANGTSGVVRGYVLATGDVQIIAAPSGEVSISGVSFDPGI